jgi:hypothetical protein
VRCSAVGGAWNDANCEVHLVPLRYPRGGLIDGTPMGEVGVVHSSVVVPHEGDYLTHLKSIEPI